MMNRPPLNELLEKVDCRYTLVTVVAQRARQLLSNPEKLGNNKPVSMAVEELYEDKLKLEFPEENND